MNPTTLVAFDLGMHNLGVAHFIGDKLESHYTADVKRGALCYAETLERLAKAIDWALREGTPAVFEGVQFHSKGREAMYSWARASGILMVSAHRLRCPLFSVPVAKVKLAAGYGHNSKADMVAAARFKWPTFAERFDEHQADAAWCGYAYLLGYAEPAGENKGHAKARAIAERKQARSEAKAAREAAKKE
jgi:Holliday junction resolvasome RuvABC endonuclease subunit